MGAKELILLAVVAVVAVLLYLKITAGKAKQPVTPSVQPTPEPTAKKELGVFHGINMSTDVIMERGITSFGTNYRKVGCLSAAYPVGLEDDRPVEVCLRATHGESGKTMPIYERDTHLRCDGRWSVAYSFDFWPLWERPGTGKPTNCHPHMQVLIDQQWAAFEAAQKALDATASESPYIGLPVPTRKIKVSAEEAEAKGTCCTPNPVVTTVAIPDDAETIAMEFAFRLVEDHAVKSDKPWRQFFPLQRHGCSKKKASK